MHPDNILLSGILNLNEQVVQFWIKKWNLTEEKLENITTYIQTLNDRPIYHPKLEKIINLLKGTYYVIHRVFTFLGILSYFMI